MEANPARGTVDVGLMVPERIDLYFRRLVDNLPAGAYTCDADGLITYYNQEAIKVWGREPKLHDRKDRFCGSFKLFDSAGAPLEHDECWMALAIRHEQGYNGEEIVVEQPDGRRLTVLAHANPIHDESGRLLGAINMLVDISSHKRAEAKLREQTRTLETVNRVAGTLAGELDLKRLVQTVTDAGTDLSRAEAGAFFYNVADEQGGTYSLYTLAGVDREAFANLPMPRNTKVFGPTFRGEGVVRSDDITKDARYGDNPPYHGMPEGHPALRSYLAVPVVSRSGEVLGGLFFGHSQPGIFTGQTEELITALASHSATAIDNARLYEQARRLNESLEEKVEQRTSDLKALNEELETFNYSVAHDLRGSLRGIDGFSQLVLEECGDTLSETGQQYLSRVQRATRHMGGVIDDLLELSKLVRVPLARDEVDLGGLATAALQRLRECDSDREVAVDIEHQLKCNGDAGLLRVVVDNLLSNAWKFTRDTPHARIAVGSLEQDRERCYFVRDNGAGFDATFAHKLYKPFQRLHSPGEYEGTGIGLATVQRIIRKHGGRIWADGAPSKGATFWFTLGD